MPRVSLPLIFSACTWKNLFMDSLSKIWGCFWFRPSFFVGWVRLRSLMLGSGERYKRICKHWKRREELILRNNIYPTERGWKRLLVSPGWFLYLLAEGATISAKQKKNYTVFVLWQSPSRVQRNLLGWDCTINRALNHITAINIRGVEVETVIEGRNGKNTSTTNGTSFQTWHKY